MTTYNPLQPTWADRMADRFWARINQAITDNRSNILAFCAGLLLGCLSF